MKKAFTMIELMTVIAILALLTASMTAAVRKVMLSTEIARATAETRELINSILSYENISKGYKLSPVSALDVSVQDFPWLFGQGGTSEDGEDSTALIKAALRSDGVMCDPWGTPYKISIVPGDASIKERILQNVTTSLFMPNFYKVSAEEEGLK